MVPALLAAGWLLAATPASATPPVAVMPFKNLNKDPATDWMSRGISETILSDLSKAGVAIVERDQIDRAIREIDVSNAADADAAKVGKMLGAKTVVLGSFQKGGDELRINARFVDVETGTILDTAKATGSATDPFAVQDQIVARLLPKNAPARPKRSKAKPATVEAYHLYAISLTMVSDADRAGFLKQSLALDPDFVYAADDLAALEKRMAGYRQQADAKLDVEDEKLLDRVLDANRSDPDRMADAKTLLQGLQEYKRYHGVLAAATKIYQAQSTPADVREYASACRVKALFDLRKDDLMLQAGEQHLKEFAGGPLFPKVQGVMQTVIDKRHVWANRKDEYDKDLAEKRAGAKGADFDYAPCIAARWDGQQNQLMIDGCEPFVSKYATSSDPDVKEKVEAARFFLVLAYVDHGDFDKAKAQAAFLTDSKEWADPLRAEQATWPTD